MFVIGLIDGETYLIEAGLADVDDIEGFDVNDQLVVDEGRTHSAFDIIINIVIQTFQ